jgi:hypothetical protein
MADVSMNAVQCRAVLGLQRISRGRSATEPPKTALSRFLRLVLYGPPPEGDLPSGRAVAVVRRRKRTSTLRRSTPSRPPRGAGSELRLPDLGGDRSDCRHPNSTRAPCQTRRIPAYRIGRTDMIVHIRHLPAIVACLSLCPSNPSSASDRADRRPRGRPRLRCLHAESDRGQCLAGGESRVRGRVQRARGLPGHTYPALPHLFRRARMRGRALDDPT